MADRQKGAFLNFWRIAGWGGAAALLAAPLLAMQVTDEVNWSAGDFLFAGALLGGAGLALEGAARVSKTYFVAAAAGLAAIVLLVAANGAVGIIGDEGNPANRFYVGVAGVALFGALLARFRASGMALAMAAAAIAMIAVAAFADPSGAKTWMITAGFAGVLFLSAVLFRLAARRNAAPAD